MVVQGHVAHQCLLQIFSTVEAVGLEDIGNAAIKALDHAIGPRRSGLGETMLDPQRLAQLVKLVVATGLTLTAGKETIGELLAVVGQHLGDRDGVSFVQSLQERLGTGCCLASFNLHIHPAGRAVNGDVQIAAFVLVLHLRQVLHIHVQIAWYVAFESLVGVDFHANLTLRQEPVGRWQ